MMLACRLAPHAQSGVLPAHPPAMHMQLGPVLGRHPMLAARRRLGCNLCGPQGSHWRPEVPPMPSFLACSPGPAFERFQVFCFAVLPTARWCGCYFVQGLQQMAALQWCYA